MRERSQAMAEGTMGLLVFTAIFAVLLNVGRVAGDAALVVAGIFGVALTLGAFVLLNWNEWRWRRGKEVQRPEGIRGPGRFPEDERIKIIAHHVRDHGKTVAVCVDDVPGKPERYARKLRKHGCRVIQQVAGPVSGAITLRVGPTNVN